MKKEFTLMLFFIFVTALIFGQSNSLFDREEPLDMALSISVKEVKKNKR